MNSLIIATEDIQKRNGNDVFISSPKIYQHFNEVLNKSKLEQSSEISGDYKITLIDEGIYLAQLVLLTKELIHFRIKKHLYASKGFSPWVDIVVGASRPQTMKKVLEHGTTFGVGHFNIFTASLSEKSYLQSRVFTDEKNDYLFAGLSQSAHYFKLPTVELTNFNPAAKYKNYDYKFILDFDDACSFLNVELPDLSQREIMITPPKIILAIGPERGFKPVDIAPFIDNGFKKVTISRSVLRVEHALFACLAQLEMLTKKY